MAQAPDPVGAAKAVTAKWAALRGAVQSHATRTVTERERRAREKSDDTKYKKLHKPTKGS